MLLPTDSIKELNDLIRHNNTHCFGIDPGVAGWCATCRVRPETVSRVTSRAALYLMNVFYNMIARSFGLCIKFLKN